jgi:DtxR family Mn-dependent transcriptional regulator
MKRLHASEVGTKGKVVGVVDSSDNFLAHLGHLGINLGTEISISDKADYDGSMTISLNEERVNISESTAKNILIEQL